MRLFKLYSQEVAEELKKDRELALIFYASYSGYDWEIDPTHNEHWCAHVAPKLEKEALKRAKLGQYQAKLWLENNEDSPSLRSVILILRVRAVRLSTTE